MSEIPAPADRREPLDPQGRIQKSYLHYPMSVIGGGALPWVMRYPLVSGQGNFGSAGNDPAAAMRYTECKMAPLAMEMVRDIGENTVDFKPNYDGKETEPVVLPARFPNLLVNGSTGIAVGMATNIPTHNLR